jgi:NitT/TauT family transport system permease protein
MVSVPSRLARRIGTKRSRISVRQIVSPVVLLALMLGIWEAYIRFGEVSELVLPAPSRVARIAIDQTDLYIEQSWVTLAEVVMGFLLASAVGLLLGVVIALWRAASEAIYPLLIASQVMPKVAIAPLTIVWFGFGMTSKVVITALIAFFPVVINTIVGLNQTTTDGLHLLRTMGASRTQTFVKLQLPLALPMIFSGVKLAATLAVVGAVVGEFAGGSEGLGHLLLVQSGQLNTAAAFVNLIYLTIIGMVVFGAVAFVERLVVPAHMLRRFTD